VEESATISLELAQLSPRPIFPMLLAKSSQFVSERKFALFAGKNCGGFAMSMCPEPVFDVPQLTAKVGLLPDTRPHETGSPSPIVQQNFQPQQVEISPPIHLPLQKLQPVDMPFCGAVVPGLPDGFIYGRFVPFETDGKFLSSLMVDWTHFFSQEFHHRLTGCGSSA
jgi:hypothetical protein